MLAYALRNAADSAAITEYLEPDTFTSDVRFEVCAAIADVVRSGLRVSRERVASSLREREALIPAPRRREHYGGDGLPWAQAYLRRLDQTWVQAEDARSAAASLRAEDRRAVGRLAATRQPTAARQRTAVRRDPERPILARARRPAVPAPSPGAARQRVS